MQDENTVLARKYASDLSIPEELAQILAQRFPVYRDAKSFLNPDIKDLYPPDTIPDIETAADIIIESIKKNEGLLIYSHDDVDGYTAAAVMYKTLKEISRDTEKLFVYPVVREKDGYILNPDVLDDFKKRGVELVITVDFGISNRENFTIARTRGLKLVVCDHHETRNTDFPVPAVDPKRPDSNYPFRELAGVGVSFKLAQFLYQKVFKLSADEFYRLKKDFFVLVMLGTFSDRVTLLQENRIFCTCGMEILKKRELPWTGLFRKDNELTINQITEEIIPTLASAAYCNPQYGVDFLIKDDRKYLNAILEELKTTTGERRRGADRLFREAVSAAKILPEIVVSIVPFSKQHYLGVVASRMKSRFKRTAVVIGLKDEKCFGELRSYNLDLYKMLQSFQELFQDFGGHKSAAGFTMVKENLDRFVEAVIRYVSDDGDSTTENNEATLKKEKPVFLDKSNVHILKPLLPFGEGNPPPVLTDGINFYTIDNRLRIIDRGIDNGES
ncbi:MAG TPA: hypothetical protein ENI34_10500 [candidate division WOR-3 bacterium]|uniref:DDH domain-containing protein n=1 Tax=candidate division WOR-3 bacterium TaxID=2052148 RepID=A0A9C9EPE3_UNCW3|nr:hypothetical protein [candidate division WOR-3 bacterium]